MIPYRDDNPTDSTPVFVLIFIGVNLAVFGLSLAAPEGFESWVTRWGLVPAALWKDPLGGVPPHVTGVFSSMWLHGGFLHILGNLWFLWIFGDNVEDHLGHGRFVVFYVLCGVLATLTHAVIASDASMPLVGASGAIAGVLAAYLRFYPRHTVRTFVPIFIIFITVHIPSAIFIFLWLAMQVLGQLQWNAAVAAGQDIGGGVAYGAHLGGFVAGLILAGPFSEGRGKPRRPPRVVRD